MLKSYKYKIKPNEDQIVLLNKHFGSIRFAYNYFLNERKVEYETNKQTLNYNDNSATLTKLKKQDDASDCCLQAIYYIEKILKINI